MMEFAIAVSLLSLCVLVGAKILSDLSWNVFCVIRWYCEREDKKSSKGEAPPVVAAQA